MSADNGVILQKITSLKYVVIAWSGDYENNRREFDNLEDAITFISENCNDTEYGIQLNGFEQLSNNPTKEGV